MLKNFVKGGFLILGLMIIYGCASAKNVEVRSYVDAKERVDQQMEDGNAGYVFGTPKPEDRSQYKKTRNIYVVEFSKEAPADDASAVAPAAASESPAVDEPVEEPVMEKPAYKTERVTRYDLEETSSDDNAIIINNEDFQEKEEISAVSSTPAGSYTQYTVQKDDTLQKISKKFFNSYSKWTKIYEVNKDVIDNPDHIKPGIVIRIPQL